MNSFYCLISLNTEIGKVMFSTKIIMRLTILTLWVNDVHGMQSDISIADLKSMATMQKAFEFIVGEEEQNIADLILLTEIPAPPFMEDARANHFAKMLRASGANDVQIDDVGNVIATIKGSVGSKTVAVAAHLDTVFPIDTVIKVQRTGNRLTAPGIGDNTRGLIMVNTLMKAIRAAQIEMQANVLLVGTVGEEGLGDLRGVKHLFRDGAPSIDSFIAIDGVDPKRIVTSGIGSKRYRVTFAGLGGHSWRDFGYANPHHAIGHAIALLDEKALLVTSKGEKSSYNIGRIGGGTSINSIPYSSWMEVDLRSGSQEQLDKLDAVLKEALQQALLIENSSRKHGPALTVDIKEVGARPAAKGDHKLGIVKKALEIHRAFGYETKLAAGSTDSNIPISKGIPAVTISRGGKGGEAHSEREWWENDNGYKGIQIALLLLVAEAGLAEPIN